MPIVTRFGKVGTYNNKLQTIKSHDPSITWSREVIILLPHIKSYILLNNQSGEVTWKN